MRKAQKVRKLTNPKLQAVLQRLRLGPATTRDLVVDCEVMAVNTPIRELRHHGCTIDVHQEWRGNSKVWVYTLTHDPHRIRKAG